MQTDNEQLSALIDNEVVDKPLVDELIIDKMQQTKFARYHLIGDVMRDEVAEPLIDIDISEKVMAAIKAQAPSAEVTKLDTAVNKMPSAKRTNIVSLMHRFGQYAIAASVAGVVVVTTLMTSPSVVENNDTGLEVLSTVPLGGAVTPVSLQANNSKSKQALKEHNERLEALLKDHQLQLQLQP